MPLRSPKTGFRSPSSPCLNSTSVRLGANQAGSSSTAVFRYLVPNDLKRSVSPVAAHSARNILISPGFGKTASLPDSPRAAELVPGSIRGSEVEKPLSLQALRDELMGLRFSVRRLTEELHRERNERLERERRVQSSFAEQLAEAVDKAVSDACARAEEHCDAAIQRALGRHHETSVRSTLRFASAVEELASEEPSRPSEPCLPQGSVDESAAAGTGPKIRTKLEDLYSAIASQQGERGSQSSHAHEQADRAAPWGTRRAPTTYESKEKQANDNALNTEERRLSHQAPEDPQPSQAKKKKPGLDDLYAALGDDTWRPKTGSEHWSIYDEKGPRSRSHTEQGERSEGLSGHNC